MGSEYNRTQKLVTIVSLGWLLAANLVGVLLAILLLAPSVNEQLSPFTYGRLMPLHTDWQLYGWCSIPLLGLLGMQYWNSNDRGFDRMARALSLWSFALLAGGAYWLAGVAVGKPFLNWEGGARIMFVSAQSLIWIQILLGWNEIRKLRGARYEGSPRVLVKGFFAFALGAVPVALFITSRTTVYPPVNPNSGGATGHSLLLSTLAIVALMGILPGVVFRLPALRKRPAGEGGRARDRLRSRGMVFGLAFAASLGVYAIIEHGNVSHRSAGQILGLASLLVWPALVGWHWGGFRWSDESYRWRMAFLVWWGALALNGVATFLPGSLETLKFTNALVAHAHLAMGGMVTALNMIILVELGADRTTRKALDRRWPFWLWNVGLAAYVLSMLAQGVREGVDPARLFLADSTTQSLYGIRMIAGAAMAAANGGWIWRCLRGANRAVRARNLGSKRETNLGQMLTSATKGTPAQARTESGLPRPESASERLIESCR